MSSKENSRVPSSKAITRRHFLQGVAAATGVALVGCGDDEKQVAADVGPETTADVGPDTSPDLVIDTSMDVAVDVAPDAELETSPDLTEDISVAEDLDTADIPTLVLPTPDFYVSSSTGDDSLDGRTEATAWARLGRVNEASLSAGDVVGFRAGDVWNERFVLTDMSGADGAPIVLTSFGEGEKPRISDITLSEHTFARVEGDIWRSAEPTGYQGTSWVNVVPRRVKLDGAELMKAYAYSALGEVVPDGDTFRFWVGDQGTGDSRLHIHAPSDPTGRVAHKDYRIGYNYLSGCHYLTLLNLEFAGGQDQGLRITGGCSNVVLDHVTIGDMCYSGVTVRDGCSEIVFRHCIVDANYTLNYWNAIPNTAEFTGAGDGIRFIECTGGEVADCTFRDWGHAALSLTGTTASSVITGIRMHHNTLEAVNIPYGGGFTTDGTNVHHNEFHDNFVFQTKDCQVQGHHNHVHHNVFEEQQNTSIHNYNFGHGITIHNYYAESPAAHDNIIEDNTFLRCDGAGVRTVGASPGPVHGNIIRRNTMVDCGQDYGQIGLELYHPGADTANANTYQDNTIYHASTLLTVRYYGEDISVSDLQARDGDAYGNVFSGNSSDAP